LNAWARRRAGRDPRRILPSRRPTGYAGGPPPRVAANDNSPNVAMPAPARRLMRLWPAAAALVGLLIGTLYFV
jgi:hypothetical protein